MRQAMCALLFDHLEAEEITSAAFTDNPASLAVSRKVGYIRAEQPPRVEGIAPLRAAIGLPEAP
jgi:RimJ/RimL family protein N-acetyltransferase